MKLDLSFLTIPLAHRGLHDINDKRPENSRSGIKAAIKHGYGNEIDLQMSKDGVPMVFHDYDLKRLTGISGAVAQHTAAELGQIKLLHGDEGIPTLEEILTLVAGQVPLLIEIKDQDGALGKNVGALEKATCQLLRNYHGPVGLMSFNPHSVAMCQTHAPDIPRGLVTDPFTKNDWPLVPEQRLADLRSIPDYKRLKASFISHNRADLASDAVANIDGDILCWTVRSAEQEAEARKYAGNITFEGYLAPK